MHLNALLCLSTAIVATLAKPVADWKTAAGWDGEILTVNDIGSTLYESSELEKRAVGGVFICTDVNWGGTCGYAVQPLNTCIVLGSDWNNKISSFGPDDCTGCYAYDDSGCGTIEWEFFYPGSDDGGITKSSMNPWNDKISSFKCFQTTC